MDLSAINWLAVLVAALVFFGLGALWYGPLFGKAWQRAVGLSDADLKDGKAGKLFVSAFIMAVIISVGMAIFLYGPGEHTDFDVRSGAIIGLMAGVLFILPTTVMNYILARRPLPLILIDSFYHIVAYTLVGTLLGAWQ